jgi:hypothetical protein
MVPGPPRRLYCRDRRPWCLLVLIHLALILAPASVGFALPIEARAASSDFLGDADDAYCRVRRDVRAEWGLRLAEAEVRPSLPADLPDDPPRIAPPPVRSPLPPSEHRPYLLRRCRAPGSPPTAAR